MTDIKKLEWEIMEVGDLLQQKSALIDLYFLAEKTSPQYAKLVAIDIGKLEDIIDIRLANPQPTS